MSVQITMAAPHDAVSLAALMSAVWPDDSADVQRIRRVLATEQHSTLLAWWDDNLIGFVDAFMTTSLDGYRRWELDLLAVHPDFCGQGIATALVQQCSAIGAAQGTEWVRALTRQDNAAVHRVFEKCGYQNMAQLYVLAVADGYGTQAGLCPGCVPVETLTYAGVWFEGTLDRTHLETARQTTPQGNICGVLIPTGHDVLDSSTTSGYTVVGNYQWWKRSYQAHL